MAAARRFNSSPSLELLWGCPAPRKSRTSSFRSLPLRLALHVALLLAHRCRCSCLCARVQEREPLGTLDRVAQRQGSAEQKGAHAGRAQHVAKVAAECEHAVAEEVCMVNAQLESWRTREEKREDQLQHTGHAPHRVLKLGDRFEAMQESEGNVRRERDHWQQHEEHPYRVAVGRVSVVQQEDRQNPDTPGRPERMQDLGRCSPHHHEEA
mmetsp:Transcript_11849/g.35424  ORF Transcript_11849/g.35424 Transcript_11849/m.35424 type:complete len:210 (-) Transcript_11849:301-930(-)